VPIVKNLLETDFAGIPINDFIFEIRRKADKAETHIAFQGEVPCYVSKAPKLRQMADSLDLARDAAASGDRFKIKELKNLIAVGRMALEMNAQHIVLLSLAKNDRSILVDCGYELKEKRSNKSVPNLLNHSPQLFVKHGSASGRIIIRIKRIKKYTSVELQMTEQDPTIETSWSGRGIHTKSRFEQKGLEPATKIYFRARYHVDGGIGRWSSPIGIIVL
jgi:hypothetical protein